MHILTQDGLLWRTLPCPIPASQRQKLQGVRLAGAAAAAIRERGDPAQGVQPRRHPGRPPAHPRRPHAGRIVTIEPADTTLRVIDSNGELLTIVPRTSPGEITRFKAHGSKHSH
jgi:hypothetical protein